MSNGKRQNKPQKPRRSSKHQSDIELVVIRSKQIAYRMIHELNGDEAETFQERVSSLAYLFSQSDIKKLRFIGAVRNSLVHDPNQNTLRNRDGFIDACNQIDTAINRVYRI